MEIEASSDMGFDWSYDNDDDDTKKKHLIGVVGTSRHGLVDKDVAKTIVHETLDELTESMNGNDSAIVSGAGLVPKLAFQWARQKSIDGIQVVSSAVRGTPKGVTSRIEVGEKHGDESDQFVSMIHVLVRIGGGQQSLKEVDLFRKCNPDGRVIERDLPLKGED